jgi:hypothetical protein
MEKKKKNMPTLYNLFPIRKFGDERRIGKKKN